MLNTVIIVIIPCICTGTVSEKPRVLNKQWCFPCRQHPSEESWREVLLSSLHQANDSSLCLQLSLMGVAGEVADVPKGGEIVYGVSEEYCESMGKNGANINALL